MNHHGSWLISIPSCCVTSDDLINLRDKVYLRVPLTHFGDPISGGGGILQKNLWLCDVNIHDCIEGLLSSYLIKRDIITVC